MESGAEQRNPEWCSWAEESGMEISKEEKGEDEQEEEEEENYEEQEEE